MIQNVGNISQVYSALSAEVSPVKQFVEQKTADSRQQNQPVLSQVQVQPDRYRDFMQLSNYIPSDTGNCSCGKCERCLGKDKEQTADQLNFKKKSEVGSDKELTAEDKDKLEKLQQRDQEVRTHEQAHVNAGAKNAQYEYKNGPDGKRYATGGHAEIETSKGRSPQETLTKAEQIKRAALAPSDPSSQDRKVAAEAEQMIAEARREQGKKQVTAGEDNLKAAKPESGDEKLQTELNHIYQDDFKKNGISETENDTAINSANQFSALARFSSSQLKDITQNYSRLNNLNSRIAAGGLIDIDS